MLKRHILAACAACLGSAAVLEAATLTIEPVGGVWSSSTSADGGAIDGVGSGSLAWGTPGFTRQSGYRFEGRGGFSAQSGQSFSIGTFTHENFPIYGKGLSSASLQVSFQIAGLTGPVSSTFSFMHTETSNGEATCADGGQNGVGVNLAGCADRVGLAMNDGLTQRFEMGGMSYTLEVLGFQHDGAFVETLWTEEDNAKEAELIARFTAQALPQKPIPPVAAPPVPEVPLAGSGLFFATFLLGLGGIGAVGKVRFRKRYDG